MSEEKYAASFGTKAKQIVLNRCGYFLKRFLKYRDSISHINVLGEDLTIINASIDKQKKL